MASEAAPDADGRRGVLGLSARVWSAGEALGWKLRQLEVPSGSAVRARFVHETRGEAFAVVVEARDETSRCFLRLRHAQASYSGTLAPSEGRDYSWKRWLLEVLARAANQRLARGTEGPFLERIGRARGEGEGGDAAESAAARVLCAETVMELLAPCWHVGDEVFDGHVLAGARAVSNQASGPVEIRFERAGDAVVRGTGTAGTPEDPTVVVIPRTDDGDARRGGAHVVVADRAGRICEATDALEALVGFALAIGDGGGREWAAAASRVPEESPHEDTFCILPWTMLDVKQQGQLLPCDLFARPLRADDGVPLDIRRHTLTQAWRSEDLKRVREAHASGRRIPECERCWRVEATGGDSRRTTYRRELSHLVPLARAGQATLAFLSFFPGNKCNLRCRTCAPGASSALIRETREVEQAVVGRGGKPLPVLPMVPENWLRDATRLRESLDELGPGLAQIEFLGGEPLLFDEHFDLLAVLVDQGHAAHIELRYVTNGTRLPPRTAQLWPRFRRVGLQVSLDGVGPRFEYLRHPARWDAVVAHIEAFRAVADRVDVSTNATFSLLSAYYLPELFAWTRERGLRCTLNSFGEPRWLDPRSLTPRAKRAVRGRLGAGRSGADESERGNVDALLDLMDSADWSLQELPSFRLRTQLHDEYRGESFAAVFPELAELLEA